MACESPLLIVNPRYKDMSDKELSTVCLERYGLHNEKPPDYLLEVPCGKCFSCQKKRLQNFRMRLMYEFTECKTALFITLSFCDSALEEYKQNYNKAVCQFMDALRKKYGKEIRHFFVMEYGHDDMYIARNGETRKGTARPHFHGLMFGVPYLDFYVFESIWNRGNGRLRNEKIPYEGFYKKPRGYVFLESVREPEKCASYVCKYLTKEYSKDKPLPRVITSRGLGAQYLTKRNVARHRSELDTSLTLGGYPFSLPPYYRNKIFTKEDKIALVLKRYNDTTPFVRVVDGREYYDIASFWRAREDFHKKQMRLGLSPRPKPPEIRQPKLDFVPDLLSTLSDPDREFDIFEEEPF